MEHLPINYVHPESLLTFIKLVPKPPHLLSKNKMGLYKCKCGVEKVITIANVKNGGTLSCGCLYKEICGKWNTIHGFSKHPLFKVWNGMIQRCYNEKSPNYSNYGGKGVKVCEEWRNSNESFFKWALENGWEQGLKVDKDIKAMKLGLQPNLYSPERCSIVTAKENSNCGVGNVFWEYNGQKMTIKQWSEKIGIKPDTLRDRVAKQNWSIEKALTEKGAKNYRYFKYKNENLMEFLERYLLLIDCIY